MCSLGLFDPDQKVWTHTYASLFLLTKLSFLSEHYLLDTTLGNAPKECVFSEVHGIRLWVNPLKNETNSVFSDVTKENTSFYYVLDWTGNYRLAGWKNEIGQQHLTVFPHPCVFLSGPRTVHSHNSHAMPNYAFKIFSQHLWFGK